MDMYIDMYNKILIFLPVSCILCYDDDDHSVIAKEEPQAAYPTSFTWAFHIAASILTGC